MSITFKNTLHVAITVLAIGLLSPDQRAYAQPATAPALTSVLPTGGGQALLDTSDSVLLLLDHQAV